MRYRVRAGPAPRPNKPWYGSSTFLSRRAVSVRRPSLSTQLVADAASWVARSQLR